MLRSRGHSPVAGAVAALVSVLLLVSAIAVGGPAGAAPGSPGAPTAGAFVSVAPARLLDTPMGTGAPAAPIAAHQAVALQVGGRGGVPATGVSAVVLNVTVTQPGAGGFLTAYADGTALPLASNLNFSPGQTVPNLVVAPVGATGQVDLYNGSAGSTHLIADVTGYFLAGAPATAGAFGSLPPARLLDTPMGTGAPAAPIAAHQVVALQVGGRGGVPATGVSAVVLNVTVTQPGAGGFLTAYAEGTALPLASNLNFSPGQTVPNLVVAPVGANGQVDLYNGSAGSTHLIADVTGYFLAGAPATAGAFGSLPPARLLDTPMGTGAPAAPVAAHQAVALQVGGRGGVPATGVSAVVLNVTVTQPGAGGFLTAYADGTALPLASNLNFSPGQTVPNLVVAPVGANGQVDLYNGSAGSTHLLADVTGYFLAGAPATAGAFGSLPPARLLDTPMGTGAPAAPVAAHQVVALQVGGRGGVPATGVSAVVLNVTVTQPGAGGFLTAYADGTALPLASNLNFSPGQTVPNLVVAPVGADGKVDLYNGSAGSTHLIADVTGYFLAGAPATAGAFGSLPPARLLDTPMGTGAPAAPVAAHQAVALQVGGRGGVPATGVSAVVLNVTVTQPSAGGFLTAYADGTALPLASNLNFSPGQTVPNLVVAPVGANGQVDLYNGSAGSTHLLADVTGYFLAGTPATAGAFGSLPPARLLDTPMGTGAPAAPVAAHQAVALQVGGRGGVPATGVSAVVLNVTVTQPGAGGFLTAYADGTALPLASNLNFSPGQTVPNLVVAPVGANGKVDLYNGSAGSTHLIADVTGYFLAGGDGTVLAWGYNGTANSSTPVQVAGLTGATAVAGGALAGYALRGDGTVWAWATTTTASWGTAPPRTPAPRCRSPGSPAPPPSPPATAAGTRCAATAP